MVLEFVQVCVGLILCACVFWVRSKIFDMVVVDAFFLCFAAGGGGTRGFEWLKGKLRSILKGFLKNHRHFSSYSAWALLEHIWPVV